MELDKLHVSQLRPSLMSESAAVTKGCGRIGGGAEECTTPARRQDDTPGEERLDPVRLLIIDSDPPTATLSDDQLKRLMVLKEGDLLQCPHLPDHKV